MYSQDFLYTPPQGRNPPFFPLFFSVKQKGALRAAIALIDRLCSQTQQPWHRAIPRAGCTSALHAAATTWRRWSIKKAKITPRIFTLLAFCKGGKEAREDVDEKQRDHFFVSTW